LLGRYYRYGLGWDYRRLHRSRLLGRHRNRLLGNSRTMGVWANMSELATSKPSSTVLARADAFRKAVFVRIFIFCLLFNVLFPGQMYLKAK